MAKNTITTSLSSVAWETSQSPVICAACRLGQCSLQSIACESFDAGCGPAAERARMHVMAQQLDSESIVSVSYVIVVLCEESKRM